MKTAVAYIRVSLKEENPANQLYVIQKWAVENGYKVVPFYDLAVSGSVDPFQRPGFRMMLDYMKANNITTIIVAELERLTRDVEHYEKLKDLKKIIGWLIEEDIEVISIADQKFMEIISDIRRVVKSFRESLPKNVKFMKPIYDMVAQILITIAEKMPELKIAVAQAERERIIERTRRAMERLKAEGRVYTKPRFIHWLALYRSGKKELRQLTRDEIEEAKRYFIEQYVMPVKQGIPIRRVYKKFLRQEKPVIELIKRHREAEIRKRIELGQKPPRRIETYSSYTAFYNLVKQLAT